MKFLEIQSIAKSFQSGLIFVYVRKGTAVVFANELVIDHIQKSFEEEFFNICRLR
jgi:hypothetical protein